MKNFFVTYRPFLKFLFVFFVTYGLLSFFYSLYLSQYENLEYPVDTFTEIVSKQVNSVYSFFEVDALTEKFPREKWYRLYYSNKYIAYIVEGCNAISVMILFTAFVVAFARNFIKTFVFIITGLILIHILNVFRISLLGSLMFHFPEHIHLLHGVLFPLIIYGFVFILWVVWIRKYSGFITKKRNEES